MSVDRMGSGVRRRPTSLAIVALVVVIGCGPAIRGQDRTRGVWCGIEGANIVFRSLARAISTAEGGLEVLAFTGFRDQASSIALSIPRSGPGTFALTNAPGLSLHYSRSLNSSSSKDHFDARRDLPGSTVSVTITTLGEVGEEVEGSFRGVLVNRHGESMIITNGGFRVVRTAAVADQ